MALNTPKKKKRWIWIVVAAAVVLLYSFYRAGQSKEAAAPETVVRTYTIQKSSFKNTVTANGTVESQSETTVSTASTNTVASVNVEVGDMVQEGDVIATLDTADIMKNISKQDKANSDKLEQMAKDVQNKLDEKNYVWGQKPDDSVDQDSEIYKTWAHQFASANGAYFDALDDYNDALTNGVDNDTLSDLQEQLADCTIKATASGTITELDAMVGARITNGTVAVISDINHLQVSVMIDQYDIMKIAVGMKAEVTSDVVEGTTFAATVISKSPVSTGKGYEVVCALDDETDQLLIGMDAKVSILISQEDDVLLVPIDAVGTDDAGNRVIYVQQSDGSFSPVTVTTGDSSDYYIVVSGEGIGEGTVIRASADASQAEVASTAGTENSSGMSFSMNDNGGGQGGGEPPSPDEGPQGDGQ